MITTLNLLALAVVVVLLVYLAKVGLMFVARWFGCEDTDKDIDE